MPAHWLAAAQPRLRSSCCLKARLVAHCQYDMCGTTLLHAVSVMPPSPQETVAVSKLSAASRVIGGSRNEGTFVFHTSVEI
jgi:hypothetical protein